jgi:hypothetical protein
MLALLAASWTQASSEGATAVNACMQDAMIMFDAPGSMGTADYTLKVPRIARVKQSMKRVLPEVAPIVRRFSA